MISICTAVTVGLLNCLMHFRHRASVIIATLRTQNKEGQRHMHEQECEKNQYYKRD